MGRRGVEVVLMAAPGEDAAVHERMQGLDAAIHHFGEAGDVRDIRHGQPGVGDGLGGASRGDQFEASALQPGGQGRQAGFVGNAQEGSSHGVLERTYYRTVTSM